MKAPSIVRSEPIANKEAPSRQGVFFYPPVKCLTPPPAYAIVKEPCKVTQTIKDHAALQGIFVLVEGLCYVRIGSENKLDRTRQREP